MAHQPNKNSQPTEAQELAAVLGRTPPSSAAGFTVRPLTIDQIADILLVLDRLAEKGVTLEGFSQAQLLLRGARDFRDIIAIAVQSPPADIGQLNALEFAKLVAAVWQVNKDFFLQNQTALCEALGLEEKTLAGLKPLWASLSSSLVSTPAASPTSDDSPSASSTSSPTPSVANSAS